MKLITEAAIAVNGDLFSGKKSHEDLIVEACRARSYGTNIQYGFLTNEGHFVTREKAREIALAAGQITKTRHATKLFTPDMKWGKR